MCLFVPALRRFVHNERIHDALCALFSLVQELFFFFILGLKGTERLHRRSTDERERESKGVKKEELLSLLKNSIALFFFPLFWLRFMLVVMCVRFLCLRQK